MEVTGNLQAFLDLASDERHADAVAAFLSLDAGAQLKVIEGLKARSDELMRSNLQQCFQICGLLEALSEATGDPLQRALTLLTLGNAWSIGQGEFRKGLEAYNQASHIYADLGLVVKQAESVIGKLYALMNLGLYDQAFEEGEWARDVLREHEEWFILARLKVNLAMLHGRLGRDAEALELFDRAKETYARLGAEGEAHWLRVELNRAVVLRNLGDFEASIAASQVALEMHLKLGQTVAAARARQNLAITYFVMGHYNLALTMLDQARQVFQGDNRTRHALLLELFYADCLLHLRRFIEVIDTCQGVRQRFTEIGNRFEVGQTYLSEASALFGLGKTEQAIEALQAARQVFIEEGNQTAAADADLRLAEIWLSTGRPAAAYDLAISCVELFEAHELSLLYARALTLAARACLQLRRFPEATELAARIQVLPTNRVAPGLTYASNAIQAELAVQRGDLEGGLASYEAAIQAVERMAWATMLEFRSAFVEDKTQIYEAAVDLCLQLHQPDRGLDYAERAKSRALIDLLSHRLDLSIQSRSQEDDAIVQKLLALQDERNRLLRRWQAGEGFGQRGTQDALLPVEMDERLRMFEIEKQVTGLWHLLLVRNADYARDAALWQVRTESIQPHLPQGTILVEYFMVRDEFVIFVATSSAVEAVRLPCKVVDIQRLVQLARLNLRVAGQSPHERQMNLLPNLQGVLQKLYTGLFAPLDARLGWPGASGHPWRLIIVPHGILHYLPFHALYDGNRYLFERCETSYLPGASLLPYCQPRHESGRGALVLGHSYHGSLPYALSEAEAVAAMWGVEPLLEQHATLATLKQNAASVQLLHLAAHGDFRPDNPLFSGVALEDGWLTTLEIFNLRLQTNLVSLSACQTGRSVIGGGDELLGMMRAFLAAGTASLLASLWAVDDRSTMKLMGRFYQHLKVGEWKAASLRLAQLSLLESNHTRHPYHWAAFYLVGDPAELK